MEARALKTSLRGEIMALKPTKPVASDELLCSNGTASCVSSMEDFSVECFLDLSNGGFEDVPVQEDQKLEEEYDDSSSNSCSLSSDSLLMDDLLLPDDIAELEWVSRFVDDSSLPELSLLLPKIKAKPQNEPQPETVRPTLSKNHLFSMSVPVKPRTKRTQNRKAHHIRPVRLISSRFTLIPNGLILTDKAETVGEPGEKRLKSKQEVVRTNGFMEGSLFHRRCIHCGTHKTPQWRAGPLGAKTLCNACGVRYKSGRLLPEYRPVGSPTFSSEIHSNSHRKVLEMRKRKESAKPTTGSIKPGQNSLIETGET